MTTRMGRRRRRRMNFPILLFFSTLLLIVAGGLFAFELIRFSQREDRLPADLSVAGVRVGGLDEQAAIARWEQAYAQPVNLLYEGSPIVLNPDTVGFRLSSDAMLADALNARTGAGGFWSRFLNYLLGQENDVVRDVPLVATYQQSLLRDFLEDIASRYDQPAGQPGFDVQTLMTFPGEPGRELMIDEAMDAIDEALNDPVNRRVELPVGSAANAVPGIETLQELIIAYLDAEGFIYDGQATIASIFILDLTTGEEINILGDVAFTAASTMKLPIVIDYYRQLNREPSADEAWLMANSLLCSNNSSSNTLMRLIGNDDQFRGIASVTDTAQYLGARNTYLTAPFVEGVAGQQLGAIQAPDTSPNPNYSTNPDPFNQTTAEDLGTLLTLLYDCAQYGSGLSVAYPDATFTPQECRQIIEIMTANDLQRLLQAGLPPNTRISHKNGWVNDTVGDAGIVFSPSGRDYVISVFLWEEAEFQNFERLWPLVEEISRAAWNYFNPQEALRNRRDDLPRTAQECYRVDSAGNIVEYVYLPPGPEAVNLSDINAWRDES